jgi:hypothetical protein
MYYIVNNNCHIYGEYSTERKAKNALKKLGYPEDKFIVTSEEFYKNMDHDVQVKNLMSGKMVTLRASQVGSCTDPSTERYWSM